MVAQLRTVFYRVQCTLFFTLKMMLKYSLPTRYTWKVAEKGFKMVVMINKLAMINFCEIILEK